MKLIKLNPCCVVEVVLECALMLWRCKFNKFLCYIFKFNYCKLLRGEKTTNGWGNFLLNTKYNGKVVQGDPPATPTLS